MSLGWLVELLQLLCACFSHVHLPFIDKVNDDEDDCSNVFAGAMRPFPCWALTVTTDNLSCLTVQSHFVVVGNL
jgi:hypothetical protein